MKKRIQVKKIKELEHFCIEINSLHEDFKDWLKLDKKELYRNKYKDDKYIFDNMIHITDNTSQHLQILKIMN